MEFFQGQSNLHPFCAPKSNDTATICYTSGTTGTPKVLVQFNEIFFDPACYINTMMIQI